MARRSPGCNWDALSQCTLSLALRAGWPRSNISHVCVRRRIGNLRSRPMTSLRDLPSVEQLLQSAARLIDEYGRPLTLDALHSTLDAIRARFKAQPEMGLPSTEAILAQAEAHLRAWTTPTLLPVIN